jgi:hypothetical protein
LRHFDHKIADGKTCKRGDAVPQTAHRRPRVPSMLADEKRRQGTSKHLSSPLDETQRHPGVAAPPRTGDEHLAASGGIRRSTVRRCEDEMMAAWEVPLGGALALGGGRGGTWLQDRLRRRAERRARLIENLTYVHESLGDLHRLAWRVHRHLQRFAFVVLPEDLRGPLNDAGNCTLMYNYRCRTPLGPIEVLPSKRWPMRGSALGRTAPTIGEKTASLRTSQ